jgi:transcriptional regulator with XRE-family HTH domain
MAIKRRVPDASPMTALQRLIREQMEQRELSYADIADRSKDSDGKARIHRNRVWQMATEPIKRSPSPKAVEGLAAGLGVPMSTVKDAISESLNLLVIRDSTDPDLAIYVDEIGTLTRSKSSVTYGWRGRCSRSSSSERVELGFHEPVRPTDDEPVQQVQRFRLEQAAAYREDERVLVDDERERFF